MCKHPSPAPWSYDYSPYRAMDGQEIPAFEVFDVNGDKIFDTNENTPAELQEMNARLAAATPVLCSALAECVRLLADYSESDGEEGMAYRSGRAALDEAWGSIT
ncbi:hypothetical protein KOR34_01160 [Posidoniimonas corsicana]|uniref:Uncharacterized protein n=1 Tax=Posidoniimonas corsicana TaxID=1938618 RepID=A0A5C5V9I3_9BACT|nr:hypothetical protein [Posidoniimonas corsicana]TWT35228.1 hypothetical protein KOR34_01160 [Posidoniimonas corsicana]